MFTIMSFQRVRRFKVLKFLWLEGCWIQRQVLSLTPLCTKASNAKKPVRYTSINKQSSDGQILNQAFPESLPDGSAIQDISEAFCSRSGEVCQVSPSTEYIAGVSLFKSTEDLSVAGTVSACKAVKVDGLSEMSADVQSSISLKDPVLAQTDILVEENQTEAAEMLPEEQLDPIQRLFLHKIREYSTKSQASAGPVDAGADYEKAFSEELSKLQRLYGGGDLTNFPGFKFSEPVLDESDSK